jgi:hypothetical protein
MQAVTKQCAEILHQNSILATVQPFQEPFEPSDGCLVLRKLMANGSNGFDACPYF